MRAFWSDPYLWVHLAGIAVVPVFLEVCLVGLAMGDPLLPGWLEIVLVAIAGIAPILWMQWQRPFSIYSLVAVALTPSQLTDDQRRILKIFKSQESRILAVIAAVVLFLVLVKIYDLSPIATPVAPQLIGGRLTGLVIAAIAFLLVNLFVQVPVSVLRALAVSQSAFADTIPYPSEQVGRDFSLLGIGVRRILPPMVMEQPRPKPSPMAAVGEPSVALDDALWDEPIAPTVSEPALEDVADTAETVGETALIDESATDADVWEASESAEEIPERGGDVGDDYVENAIATQPEAPEPEGVWNNSVELPLDAKAESAEEVELTDEAYQKGEDVGDDYVENAIATQPEAPEPEGVWNNSVELPLDAEAESTEGVELTDEAHREEAIADFRNEADSAEISDLPENSVEYSSDQNADGREEAEIASLNAAPLELNDQSDNVEQHEASATEAEPLTADERVEPFEADTNIASLTPSENEPWIDESAADEAVDSPDALAFDELFDETQDIEDGSEHEPVEEFSEVDSVGHDLVPEIDEPMQSDPHNEQQS